MWQKVMVCLFHTVLLVATTPVPLLHRTPDSGIIGANNESPLGSDLGLYNRDFFEGDIFIRKLRAKNAVWDTKQLWPNGIVVYKTDDSIGCPDSVQCSILMRAFHHYHTHSCVHFKEWTGEENFVRVFLNPNTAACWSPVGRQGGEQLVSLGQRCWYSGIVIHELGHSLGFWHEMNRPDRDEYIDIQWDNIQSGFSDAFSKYSKDTVNTLSEKFDYQSVMMYDEYAFSKNKNSPTILTKDKTIIGPLWLKKGLSASDIRRLNKLYNCGAKDQKIDFPYDVSCSFDRHTCGFKNAGTEAWKWNRINETDGYIYTTGNVTQTHNGTEDSNTNTGYFMSVNYHADSGTSPMGCVSFLYLMRGKGEMYLKLRQSYLSSTTQLAFVEDDTFDLWDSAQQEGTQSWQLVHVPLYVTNPFKLIFESTLPNTRNNLIVLDDFHLQYSPCPNSHGSSTEATADGSTSESIKLPLELLPNFKSGNQQ